jgi:hypothetical protein
MTALTEDQSVLEFRITEGKELSFPVYQSTTIYAGGFVAVRADGYAVPGDDASGLIFQGFAMEQVDNSSGSDGDKNVTVLRRGLKRAICDTAISQANVGDNVFLVDDQTVDLVANVANNIFCGIIAGYIDSTHAWIDIEPAIRQADVATHIADSSAAHAASAISIADAGSFTSQSQVEAALQEIYQHIISVQAFLNLPMGAWTEQDGTALADFGDGASTTPGWSAGDEGFGIRWNNHANPDPISASVPVPPDLDASEDVVVHVAAAKVGATAGDATKFTIEAFFNNVGAAYDADADAGGDSGAMTGDATTKTVQEVTLTLAAADVTAAPCVLTLTLQLKDGTLDTDDVIVLGVWLEYTRKLLTS